MTTCEVDASKFTGIMEYHMNTITVKSNINLNVMFNNIYATVDY